MECAGTYWPC